MTQNLELSHLWSKSVVLAGKGWEGNMEPEEQERAPVGTEDAAHAEEEEVEDEEIVEINPESPEKSSEHHSSRETAASQRPDSPGVHGSGSAEPSSSQQAALNGTEVYVYGSGADFKKKLTGVLFVQEENAGDVLVKCMEKEMSLDDFALTACNRYILTRVLMFITCSLHCHHRKENLCHEFLLHLSVSYLKRAPRRLRRPRENIKITSTGETLAAFELRHGIVRKEDPTPSSPSLSLAGPSFRTETDFEGRYTHISCLTLTHNFGILFLLKEKNLAMKLPYTESELMTYTETMRPTTRSSGHCRMHTTNRKKKRPSKLTAKATPKR